VVSGYLVRNVRDPHLAFREQFRVMRPGGRLVCLDTTPPRGPLAPLIGFYLRRVIPLLGAWIGGDRRAYTYLPESTRAFVDPAVLARALRQAGFKSVAWRTLMFGTMAIHAAVKPRE
jgi:demethylmenaquinone methyltransferase/2-methoxy-6-polyprenyl-1,4-benzoquinol methylase